MDVKDWVVCVVEPNKFERQILVDLLRYAKVGRLTVLEHADEALEVLEAYRANVIITSFELGDTNAADWTRKLRRSKEVANRKASVFVTSAAFSRSMAEQCRHAGANALIGKPLSAGVLLNTVTKVLTHPREFIDAEHYVGPCRRAGIVAAGAPLHRRRVDAPTETPSLPGLTLEQAIEALHAAANAYLLDVKQTKTCEAALRFVQAYAVNANDAPLMRVCAAFAQQLAAQHVPADARRFAIETCLDGTRSLTTKPLKPAERDFVATRCENIVNKAINTRAA